VQCEFGIAVMATINGLLVLQLRTVTSVSPWRRRGDKVDAAAEIRPHLQLSLLTRARETRGLRAELEGIPDQAPQCAKTLWALGKARSAKNQKEMLKEEPKAKN
jgi:hypothetical protein